MKAMIFAFIAVGVIAVGADLVLDRLHYSSADRFTGEAVKLGE